MPGWTAKSSMVGSAEKQRRSEPLLVLLFFLSFISFIGEGERRGREGGGSTDKGFSTRFSSGRIFTGRRFEVHICTTRR